MARFTKEIVRAGVYHVADENGNRREETISEDRIRHWAHTHRQMRKAGLNIPAPTTHSPSANPNIGRRTGNVKVQMSAGQWDAFTNGGFWDEMWSEKRPYTDPETGEMSLVETLMGSLEAPDEYADKIGTVVKETSIYAPPVFKDGKGREWKDVIAHAALVTHPIEAGQENFQPADGIAIAMSQFARPIVMAFPPEKGKPPKKPAKSGVDTAGAAGEDNQDDEDFGMNPDAEEDLAIPAGKATIADAVAELRKCGLEVGDDATPQNFLERIVLAARQKALTEGGGLEDDPNPLISEPEGGTKQPASIAMSTKPATSPEVTQLLAQNALLMGLVHQQYQSRTTDRINALVSSGRVSKALADAHFLPLVGTVKMALGADNKPEPNALDRLLAFAEALPAPARVGLPGTAMGLSPEFAQALAMSQYGIQGASLEGHPNPPELLSEKDANALGDELAGFVNFAN